MIRYICCDDRRRAALSGHAGLDGIDWVEVIDTPVHPLGPALTTLIVCFVNDAPPVLSASNVRIVATAGARAVRVVAAQLAAAGDALPDRPALVIRTDRAGDFSIYRLRLVAGLDTDDPPAGLDPILSTTDFSFRVGCEDGFDVAPALPCPAERPLAPPIDYLARDFASLRQVLLDRVAVLSPDAATSDPADLIVTLVELLAWVGDRLSYRQDAIATEATLDTARRRISARRHARLVDYVMHDGCNARTWIEIAVKKPLTVPKGTPLLTRSEGLPACLAPDSAAWIAALGRGALPFETMATIECRPERNVFAFHDWGGRCCRLPRGATSATLTGDQTAILEPGDVLILREVKNPATGATADADPGLRWAVRLTAVRGGSDPLGRAWDTPPDDTPLAVTEIEWAGEDALPFRLTLSATPTAPDAPAYVTGVAMAFGNVVLADHGASGAVEEALGIVPEPRLIALSAPRPVDTLTAAPDDAGCLAPARAAVAPRFSPVLREGPLTFAAPLRGASAAALAHSAPASARAAITLYSLDPDGRRHDWRLAFPDLLDAEGEPAFVVECDNDLLGRLRFGDGTSGMRPPVGAAFFARYRVGGGAGGNIGAGAIAHIGIAKPQGAAPVPSNPLPASGGVDPETVEEVRRRAPAAFRVQRRAVTPRDYADQATGLPGVQRAMATLAWTGSWRTHRVAVDPVGGGALGVVGRAALEAALEPIRLAGHDIAVAEPLYVSIDLALTVQVAPGHFRSAVRQALLDQLTAGRTAAGEAGLFHPDRFSFGDNVYASPVLTAVQRTAGVASVRLDRFRRQRRPDSDANADGRFSGRIAIGVNEIARLDNDPGHPDRGTLSLVLEGGQ